MRKGKDKYLKKDMAPNSIEFGTVWKPNVKSLKSSTTNCVRGSGYDRSTYVVRVGEVWRWVWWCVMSTTICHQPHTLCSQHKQDGKQHRNKSAQHRPQHTRYI